jgi:hypothetical protein
LIIDKRVQRKDRRQAKQVNGVLILSFIVMVVTHVFRLSDCMAIKSTIGRKGDSIEPEGVARRDHCPGDHGSVPRRHHDPFIVDLNPTKKMNLVITFY